MTQDIKPHLRFILIVAIPVALVTLFLGQLQQLPVAHRLIAWMQQTASEWWAIPLFVVLYIAFSVFLLPVGLLSATAAVAWGWQFASIIELVTCTVAAVVPYELARRGLARRFIKDEQRIEASFFALLLLRIVPVIPYVAVNYLAGVARIRPRAFLVATFAGSIPSVVLFAYFVDTLATGAVGAATQLRILGACVLVALMAVAVRLLSAWVRRRFL
ncbi:MAG TPA: VTT domain-containing protein [Thermoanaerobaculia bacterium]